MLLHQLLWHRLKNNFLSALLLACSSPLVVMMVVVVLLLLLRLLQLQLVLLLLLRPRPLSNGSRASIYSKWEQEEWFLLSVSAP